jgi:hypothetical protein
MARRADKNAAHIAKRAASRADETPQRVAHFFFLVGSWCLGGGLIGLGVLCLVHPHFAAEMYGLSLHASCATPTRTDEGWVLVTGLRDLVLGITTFALLALQPGSMRVFTLTLMPLPLGDALLAHTYGGSAASVATHALGSVAVAVLAGAAWCDSSLGRLDQRNKALSASSD